MVRILVKLRKHQMNKWSQRMLNIIRKYIIRNKLIEPGDRVIVAVSGGPDSMALLHILKELAAELQFEVLAAHVNHGLRPEGEAEVCFVQEQCAKWDIPCYTQTVNVRELARIEKTSLEDAGRRARYSYFHTLLDDLGATSIATAHHRDDVAETVLLHLFRGAGMQGLRGILPCQEKLIRPLLAVGKEQLLDYLAGQQIAYCLDRSNEDSTFVRNRIRHQLIPQIKQDYNPRIVENLCQLAEIMQSENAFVEAEIEKYWPLLLAEEDINTLGFDLAVFNNLPLAARRRLILRAFTQLGGQQGWEGQDVEKALELSEKMGSAKVLDLKKKIRVNKSYDKIIFTSTWAKAVPFSLEPKIPGEIVLPDDAVYQFALQPASNYVPEADHIYLDYDKLKLPLVLRSRQEGDVFQPIGFSGHKRLKKYLMEQKVPWRERDRVPVLASQDGDVYAILGFCLCQPAAVSAATRTVLIIKKC